MGHPVGVTLSSYSYSNQNLIFSIFHASSYPVVRPPLKIMMICPKPQKDFRDPIIKTTFVAEENCGCQMGIMFNVKILKMILNLSRLLRLTQCLILSILPSIDFWSNQLLHWRQISVKGFAFSSCLNGTIPWRKCSVKVYLGKLTQKRIFLFVTLLI